MSAYYNEIDPYAAQWLRNLIAAGQIAPGDVDERSIADVVEGDLAGYEQCHFFAGIGGWSVALRQAGVDDDRAVWTGSCPCQPLSKAGQQRGHADERHLWPAFHRLIAECRPAVVLGEQVASKDGREWFSAVRADLEGVGYAVGAAGLPAASVGAPHIRQRLWFVGVAERAGLEGHHGNGHDSHQPRRERAQQAGSVAATGWDDLEWLPCSDGKARPTQPGLFPLAHGVQRRASKLRAYGNAIVPQAAAEFIAACFELL